MLWPTLSERVNASRRSRNSGRIEFSTNSRLPAVHIWPALLKTAIAAVGTAMSRLASAKTMLADFPPSSSETRLRLPAAARTIAWPVAVEPVKATLSTSACSASAAPTVDPLPVTMLTTPGGRSSSARSSPSRSAARLACSEGLSTTVQPAASAGASFHSEFESGPFQGTIDATTPMGSRSVEVIMFGTGLGSVWPAILVGQPAK